MAKEGFDKRIVFYEDIHNIKPEDEKALIEAINPKPHEKILDAFCGYGAITKNCLEKEPKSDLWLNDESEVQIKHTDTDSEENRPNLPESQPKNNIGTPVRASFNFQHKIGEKEAELLEKINKEILALKNEIEKEEKTVDIATVGPALEDRI